MNIKKGNTTKNWQQIKSELVAANSAAEVQQILNKSKVTLTNNLVAGTRRKKRHGKKRTHRRH